MKTFTKYWNDRKGIFEKLGIDKDSAHMIWSDALDAFSDAYLSREIKRRK